MHLAFLACCVTSSQTPLFLSAIARDGTLANDEPGDPVVRGRAYFSQLLWYLCYKFLQCV